MDMIEVSAKTVSDAITEACQKLGVPVTSQIIRQWKKVLPDSSESEQSPL